MPPPHFANLAARIDAISPRCPVGEVTRIAEAAITVDGLNATGALGDLVILRPRRGRSVSGEIVQLGASGTVVLPDRIPEGLCLGDRCLLVGPARIAPDDTWIGRVIDPFGRPLDGRPLFPGPVSRAPVSPPPPAAQRRALGPRIETGIAAFNTVLPLARGQRLGLFAGSGVGKTTLIGALARNLDSDIAVIALIGERGRELRHFVEDVLGPSGMARAVIVSATSDMPAAQRRRCAWTAMAVAEHFRDAGLQVLLVADSITRFAEAHREIALSADEGSARDGFPPSLAHQIMTLSERAGPGIDGAGDITALFSVLVAGGDMENPVADTLRGVLDGHVVLDRTIAERGRYPAIDLLRSVSRSLPAVASPEQNALISDMRRLLSAYEAAELMIQSGFYTPGASELTDRAVACWPALDAFLAHMEPESIEQSFARLGVALAATAASGTQTP